MPPHLFALVEVDGALKLPLVLVSVVVEDVLTLRRLLQRKPASSPSLQKDAGEKLNATFEGAGSESKCSGRAIHSREHNSSV